MRDLSCLVLQEQDFPILAAGCGADPAFPKSWREWTALTAPARGAPGCDDAVAIALDPRQFFAWCNRLDVLPCLAALRAYAILQRPENRTKRYGNRLLRSEGSE